MTRKIRPIILVILICCFAFVSISKLFTYDNSSSNPQMFSNYSHTGYFQIHPETILHELNDGKSNAFAPLSEDIYYRMYLEDQAKYPNIYWSQTDYLRIVDALNREIWHESLDSRWNVLLLQMRRNCVDNPQGFNDFEIIYFQNSKIEFLDRRYPVRRFEVVAWQGLVRWGDDAFSDAIIPDWDKANLNDFQVTADDALSITEMNGGNTARQQSDNECKISISLNNYPPAYGYTKNNWLVDYSATDFSAHFRINPLSGKIQK